MINYELAKKLKEAGFEKDSHFWEIRGGETLMPYPTLEELIEACGDGYYGLYRKSKISWIAIEPGKTTNREWMAGLKHYSTPSEAVANLWLQLNDNKVENQ